MAMTSTTIQTAAQLADTYGAKLLPTRTDLSAPVGPFSIQALLLVGASPLVEGKSVKIHYAFYNTNIDATLAANSLKTDKVLECKITGAATSSNIVVSEAEVKTGNFLYSWVEIPEAISGDLQLTQSVNYTS